MDRTGVPVDRAARALGGRGGRAVTRAVLVADAMPEAREQLAGVLREAGFRVETAADGATALAALERNDFGIVVGDLGLPGAPGLFAGTRAVAPHAIVLVTVAPDTADAALEAVRVGATDYLLKPVTPADLVGKVERALEHRRLVWESGHLREVLDAAVACDPLLGESDAVRDVRARVAALAPGDGPVLLTGERGSGFDGTARALHRASPRADRLFLRVDCAAVSPTLVARRLFGHARRAFADAASAEDGLLARARGGTVYLDEVDALPRDAQLQLLRAIDAREVLPIGSREPVAIDVRIVAGACTDLPSLVAAGELDEELYARLAANALPLPPLRARREDVPALVAALVRHHNLVLRCRYRGADDGALAALAAEAWPGNLGSLELTVALAMLAGDGEWIRADDLPRRVSPEHAALLAPVEDDLRTALRAYERAHIVAVLERLAGNKRTAATRLGVSLSSLYRKLDELGIPLG